MGSILAKCNILRLDQVTTLNHRGEAPMEFLYHSAEHLLGHVPE